jgi:hypothetical protein
METCFKISTGMDNHSLDITKENLLMVKLKTPLFSISGFFFDSVQVSSKLIFMDLGL